LPVGAGEVDPDTLARHANDDIALAKPRPLDDTDRVADTQLGASVGAHRAAVGLSGRRCEVAGGIDLIPGRVATRTMPKVETAETMPVWPSRGPNRTFTRSSRCQVVVSSAVVMHGSICSIRP
jgi:hypothetical protein